MTKRLLAKKQKIKRNKASLELKALLKNFGSFHQMDDNLDQEDSLIFARANSRDTWNSVSQGEKKLENASLLQKVGAMEIGNYRLAIPFDGFLFTGFKTNQESAMNLIRHMDDLDLTDILFIHQFGQSHFCISEGEEGWAIITIEGDSR